MGNSYNYRIGKFQVRYSKFDYHSVISPSIEGSNKLIGRMGNLAFWDHKRDKLILFGGQRSGDQF